MGGKKEIREGRVVRREIREGWVEEGKNGGWMKIDRREDDGRKKRGGRREGRDSERLRNEKNWREGEKG